VFGPYNLSVLINMNKLLTSIYIVGYSYKHECVIDGSADLQYFVGWLF